VRNFHVGLLLLVLGAAIVAGYYVSSIETLPPAAFSLFPELPSPKIEDRILVLSPHQDDEILGSGGYIQQALKNGAVVRVIFASDGNKHGLGPVRQGEAISIDKKLGVAPTEIVFLDFPDGKLSDQSNFSSAVEEQIINFHPTTVITTLPEDSHPDHSICGKTVLELWRGAKDFQPLFFLVHYARYPRPIGTHSNAYLLPPIKLISAEYQWWVVPLSENDQGRKATAISSYRSQQSLKNPILRQLLWSFDRRNELFALPTD
jgi:LmbE family N-acetylglucosaminyl deacetylase